MAQADLMTDIINGSRTVFWGLVLPNGGKMTNKNPIERMAPFFTPYNKNIIEGAQIVKPADFSSHISTYLTDSMQNILYVPQNKLGFYLSDSIDKPTIYAPIIVDNGAYFTVYPTTGWNVATPVTMYYYKNPPNAVFGYTTQADGTAVYDPATSTDLIWNATEIGAIVRRTVKYVGISISDESLVALSEMGQKQGGTM